MKEGNYDSFRGNKLRKLVAALEGMKEGNIEGLRIKERGK